MRTLDPQLQDHREAVLDALYRGTVFYTNLLSKGKVDGEALTEARKRRFKNSIRRIKVELEAIKKAPLAYDCSTSRFLCDGEIMKVFETHGAGTIRRLLRCSLAPIVGDLRKLGKEVPFIIRAIRSH